MADVTRLVDHGKAADKFVPIAGRIVGCLLKRFASGDDLLIDLAKRSKKFGRVKLVLVPSLHCPPIHTILFSGHRVHIDNLAVQFLQIH